MCTCSATLQSNMHSLHNASQLVVAPRSGGEPAEGSGDKLVLEDDGEPGREEDKCGEPDHPDGCVEDEEDLGDEERNTPEEHGLWETEEESQILETVDVVSAFREVCIPFAGRTLRDFLMLRVQDDCRYDTDESAKQSEGRKEPQPSTGDERNEVHQGGAKRQVDEQTSIFLAVGKELAEVLGIHHRVEVETFEFIHKRGRNTEQDSG